MNNHLYHSVSPQNENSQGYSDSDQIDFLLDFPGRKLVPGSVRLEAICAIANVDTPTDKLKLDPQCGAHSFIESITTEMASKGVVEVINSDYARMVKSKVQATKGRVDLLSSKHISQWQSADERSSSSKLRPKVNINATNAISINNDFSISLEHCLNNIEGGNLSYNQSGYCKVSVTLARIANALYGCGHLAATNLAFTLTKVRVKFQSVPEDNQNNQLVMNTMYNVKQGISSASANISSKVPSVCKGFVGSFVKSASAVSLTANSYKTEQPPGMEEIRVMFNNASNQLLTYSLRNINDQKIKAKLAFGNTANGPCQMSNADIGTDNGGYLFGASFDSLVNLTNQKINIQFDSNIDNATPYTCFIFFMGVVAL